MERGKIFILDGTDNTGDWDSWQGASADRERCDLHKRLDMDLLSSRQESIFSILTGMISLPSQLSQSWETVNELDRNCA